MQRKSILKQKETNGIKNVMTIQLEVWHALILHDIKNRFFGSGVGYLITIVWPLTHILVILTLNAGRLAPHGSSMLLYASTAVIPYIACNYIGRFIMLGVIMNKQFLQYPVIKPLDLMIARIFLEIVSNYIVVMIVICTLVLCGTDVMPTHPQGAAAAWAASIALGVGMGVLGGVICMAWPLFQLVFVLFIIIAWVTCGMTIDPELLPENIGYYFSFNPVLHAVEWMREAYYPDFHARLLSRSYLFGFATGCFGFGLIIERIFRGFLSNAR